MLDGENSLKTIGFNRVQTISAIFEKIRNLIENGGQDGSKMVPKSILWRSGVGFLRFWEVLGGV